MKPSVAKINNFFPYLLLFVQPFFMATNIIVARGGVEFVPPISLAFWRWTLVFLILLPFTYLSLKNKSQIIKTEFKKLLEDCKFDHAAATIVLLVFIALSNSNLFLIFML